MSIIEQLKSAVGPAGWTTNAADMAPYLVDQRGRYHGRAPIMVSPATTSEVAAVLRLCHEARVPVVPQGGNTGLVGGSVPDESGGQILLSLSRMNRIRELDALDFTITVEAGCVLSAVQDAAAEVGLLFPLSLGAEGTCQIGGNLATNAGGTAVLRYGNARDLVLGLEVVLASGDVWEGLRRLRKDNTGYNLKQLFLGAEGTLGVITAAVLKLFPRPRQSQTALAAVANPEAALALLADFRAASADVVSTFEYIGRASLDLVLTHVPHTRDPFDRRYEHYVLIELGVGRGGDDLKQAMETVLADAYAADRVLDAVIAASREQAARLWRLREAIPEAARKLGVGIKNDVSVPLSRVPEFLSRARAAVARIHPHALIVDFGHLGDGNIHFNLNRPHGMTEDDFLARRDLVNRAVHDIAVGLEGSYAAEHGIGRLKREEVLRYKSPVEIALMRTLKRTLDPHNILNPGKVINP